MDKSKIDRKSNSLNSDSTDGESLEVSLNKLNDNLTYLSQRLENLEKRLECELSIKDDQISKLAKEINSLRETQTNPQLSQNDEKTNSQRVETEIANHEAKNQTAETDKANQKTKSQTTETETSNKKTNRQTVETERANKRTNRQTAEAETVKDRTNSQRVDTDIIAQHEISLSLKVLTQSLTTLIEQQRIQQQTLLSSIHAPQIKLHTFHGDPLQYEHFVKGFENVVHSSVKDESARLQILLQHCGDEVRETLQCCLHKDPKEGYSYARQLLKETYGDMETIATTRIDNLLQRPNVTSTRDLLSYSNELKTCFESVKNTSFAFEFETITNLNILTQKLPDDVYNRWIEKTSAFTCKHNKRPGIKELMQFIERVTKENSNPTYPPRHRHYHHSNTTMTNNCSDETTAKKSNKPQPHYRCPKCHDNHYLNQCGDFREMSVPERTEFILQKDLCHNCFQPHLTENCPRSWTCSVDKCGERHNRWLHPVTRYRAST